MEWDSIQGERAILQLLSDEIPDSAADFAI